MKEQVECIRAMEMREDDVIVCAFSRSGTHWLWEVASMLLTGKVEYEKHTKENAMLEAIEMEKTGALPSPRLLNTHLPVSMLPRQVKDKRIKVILVYRNVKDVFVSLYYNMLGMPGTENYTWDIHERMFLTDDCMYGTYVFYHKGMDSFIKDNPDVPVFRVSYEDTKEDPVGVVKKLAEFLGVTATSEFCSQVAEACSFQKLKEADKHKIQMPIIEQLPPEHKPVMYRKGEVGDWKNHLTVARSERLDAAIKQLEGCDYHFRYTL
nr:hypothetical protein BaRGS_029590 [Batillaria attramentaria]